MAGKFPSCRVEVEDILLVRVGKVEKAALVKPEHVDWLIDSNLTRLRTNRAEIEPKFLLEFLLRGTSIDQILATATVKVAPTMSGKNLADFLVAVPPLDEQLEIVRVLEEQERQVTALQTAAVAQEGLWHSLAEGLMSGSVQLGNKLSRPSTAVVVDTEMGSGETT